MLVVRSALALGLAVFSGFQVTEVEALDVALFDPSDLSWKTVAQAHASEFPLFNPESVSAEAGGMILDSAYSFQTAPAGANFPIMLKREKISANEFKHRAKLTNDFYARRRQLAQDQIQSAIAEAQTVEDHNKVRQLQASGEPSVYDMSTERAVVRLMTDLNRVAQMPTNYTEQYSDLREIFDNALNEHGGSVMTAITGFQRAISETQAQMLDAYSQFANQQGTQGSGDSTQDGSASDWQGAAKRFKDKPFTVAQELAELETDQTIDVKFKIKPIDKARMLQYEYYSTCEFIHAWGREAMIQEVLSGLGGQYNFCGGGTNSLRWRDGQGRGGSADYVAKLTECGVADWIIGTEPYDTPINELDRCCQIHDEDYAKFDPAEFPSAGAYHRVVREADLAVVQCLEKALPIVFDNEASLEFIRASIVVSGAFYGKMLGEDLVLKGKLAAAKLKNEINNAALLVYRSADPTNDKKVIVFKNAGSMTGGVQNELDVSIAEQENIEELEAQVAHARRIQALTNKAHVKNFKITGKLIADEVSDQVGIAKNKLALGMSRKANALHHMISELPQKAMYPMLALDADTLTQNAGWFSHKLKHSVYQKWSTLMGAGGLTTLNTVRYAYEEISSQAELLSYAHQQIEKAGRAKVNSLKNVALQKTMGFVQKWQALKYMIDDIMSVSGAGANLGARDVANMYLTGHGSAAQLATMASMYLKKTSALAMQTFTFGGTGSQCALRKEAATSANLQADLDLNTVDSHDQVKNYVNALDVMANVDYHIGKTCVFGTSKVDSNAVGVTAAKKFCGRLVGFSGADMFLPTGKAHSALKSCMYFTHMLGSVRKSLQDTTILQDDGTTDGGCTSAVDKATEIATATDVTNKCAPCFQGYGSSYSDDPANGCPAKVPKLPLLWDSFKQAVTSAGQFHPCATDVISTIPKTLTSQQLSSTQQASDLIQGLFQSCIYLGGPNDYLLVGSNDGSSLPPGAVNKYSAVLPQFNVAFQYVLMGNKLRFQTTLYLQQLVGDGAAGNVAAGQFYYRVYGLFSLAEMAKELTLRTAQDFKGEETRLLAKFKRKLAHAKHAASMMAMQALNGVIQRASQVLPLFDMALVPGSKACESVMQFELCLAVAGAANDLVFSAGFVQNTLSAAMPMGAQTLSWKVGAVSTAGIAFLQNTKPMLIAKAAQLGQDLSALVNNALFFAKATMGVTKTAFQVSNNHRCIGTSGIAAMAARLAKNQLFDVHSISGAADAADFCMILSEDVSMRFIKQAQRITDNNAAMVSAAANAGNVAVSNANVNQNIVLLDSAVLSLNELLTPGDPSSDAVQAEYHVDLTNKAEGNMELLFTEKLKTGVTMGVPNTFAVLLSEEAPDDEEFETPCHVIGTGIELCVTWTDISALSVADRASTNVEVKVYLQGETFQDFVSDQRTIFSYPASSHPCLTGNFGSDPLNTNANYLKVTQTASTETDPVDTSRDRIKFLQSCSALSGRSYLNVKSECGENAAAVATEENHCKVDIEVELDGAELLNNQRMRMLSSHESTMKYDEKTHKYVKDDLLPEDEIDFDSFDENEATTSSSRALQAVSGALLQGYLEKFVIRTQQHRVGQANVIRVVLMRFGTVYFDIDLMKDQRKCMGVPAVYELCLERSNEGSFDINTGAFVAGAHTDGTARRKLQAAAGTLAGTVADPMSFLALTVSNAGFSKAILPLATFQKTRGLQILARNAWLTATTNSNVVLAPVQTGSTVTNADDHDECREVTCAATEECFNGAEGQNFCFPNLFASVVPVAAESTAANGITSLKTQSDSQTWIQQIMKIQTAGTISTNTAAGAQLTTFATPKTIASGEVYDTTGLPANWSIKDYWCLSQTNEGKPKDDESTSNREDQGNCVGIYTYSTVTDVIASPKVCLIDFQSSEQAEEQQEKDAKSLQQGVEIVGGYHVYSKHARLFERFRDHPKYASLLLSTSRSQECSQTYVVGHHLGGVVATLHRLTTGFGRLVTFSTPGIFPQYSFPKTCSFGASFHFQDDATRFFPTGFRSGGSKLYSLCTRDGDPVSVQEFVCGTSDAEKDQTVGLNTCNVNQLERYSGFVAANLGGLKDTNAAPADIALDTNKITFGSCQTLSEYDLISTCVNRLCAADNTLANNALALKGASAMSESSKEDLEKCALGPEALSVQLALESQKVGLTSLVTSLPRIYSTASTIFDYLGDRLKESVTTNTFQMSIPGAGDNSRVGFQVIPGLDSNVAKFVITMEFPEISTTPFVLEMKVSVLPDPHVNTLHVSISSPQISSQIPGLTSFDYKLKLGAFFCRRMVGSAVNVCIVFSGTSLEFRVYFSQMADLAYRKLLANVNLNTRSFELLPTLSAQTNSEGELMRQVGRHGSISYGGPNLMVKREGLTELFAEQSETHTYCAKQDPDPTHFCVSDPDCNLKIPGSICKLNTGMQARDSAMSNTCSCPENMCLTLDNSECLPDTTPGILREIELGHPCLGLDAVEVLFTPLPDKSRGGPYERCILFSSKSYVRFNYSPITNVGALLGGRRRLENQKGTRKLQTVQLDLSAMVTSWIHLGFQSFDSFALDRLFTAKAQIVEAAPGIPGIRASLIDDSIALTDETATPGQGETLLSYAVPVTGPDRACLTVSAAVVDGRGAPVADICMVSNPTAQSEPFDDNGIQVVTTDIMLGLSLNVPVFMSEPKLMDFMKITKKTPVATASRQLSFEEEETEGEHRRQLQDTIPTTIDDGSTYSIETLPIARVAEDTGAIERDYLSLFSTEMIVFLCFIVTIFLSIPMAIVITWTKEKLEERNITIPAPAWMKRTSPWRDSVRFDSLTEEEQAREQVRSSTYYGTGEMNSGVRYARQDANFDFHARDHEGKISWAAECMQAPFWLRCLACHHVPLHIARTMAPMILVGLFHTRLQALPLFPEEVRHFENSEIRAKQQGKQVRIISPVLKKFLVWRRSALYMICAIATLNMLVIGSTEFPIMMKNLFELGDSERTHKAVVESIGMLEGLDVSAQGEAQPNKKFDSGSKSGFRKLFSSAADSAFGRKLMDIFGDAESNERLVQFEENIERMKDEAAAEIMKDPRYRHLSETDKSRALQEFIVAQEVKEHGYYVSPNANTEGVHSAAAYHGQHVNSEGNGGGLLLKLNRKLSAFFTNYSTKESQHSEDMRRIHKLMKFAEVGRKHIAQQNSVHSQGYAVSPAMASVYMKQQAKRGGLSIIGNNSATHSATQMKTDRSLQATAGQATAGQAQVAQIKNLDHAKNKIRQLGDILIIYDRVKQFGSIMALRNFLIAFTAFGFSAWALKCWHTYHESSRLIQFGFVIRIAIVAGSTYIPWWVVMFPDSDSICTPNADGSENTVCTSGLVAARLNMDFILNAPVLTLAFMLVPGIIIGSTTVTEILPFSIVPYFTIFIVPLLINVIALWPMLSLISHGIGGGNNRMGTLGDAASEAASGQDATSTQCTADGFECWDTGDSSWKLLAGSFFYVLFGIMSSYGAAKCLTSWSSFKSLGYHAEQQRKTTSASHRAHTNDDGGDTSDQLAKNSRDSSDLEDDCDLHYDEPLTESDVENDENDNAQEPSYTSDNRSTKELLNMEGGHNMDDTAWNYGSWNHNDWDSNDWSGNNWSAEEWQKWNEGNWNNQEWSNQSQQQAAPSTSQPAATSQLGISQPAVSQLATSQPSASQPTAETTSYDYSYSIPANYDYSTYDYNAATTESTSYDYNTNATATGYNSAAYSLATNSGYGTTFEEPVPIAAPDALQPVLEDKTLLTVEDSGKGKSGEGKSKGPAVTINANQEGDQSQGQPGKINRKPTAYQRENTDGDDMAAAFATVKNEDSRTISSENKIQNKKTNTVAAVATGIIASDNIDNKDVVATENKDADANKPSHETTEIVPRASPKEDKGILTSEFLSRDNDKIYQMVQATLIQHLAKGMRGPLTWWLETAKLIQYLAYIFIFWALIEVTADFVTLNITPNTFGGCLVMGVEAFMNKILMQLICIDFTFSALVKLRLFNGYMNDDPDLTNLSALFQFSTKVNLYFRRGVRAAQVAELNRLNEERRDRQARGGIAATTGGKATTAAVVPRIKPMRQVFVEMQKSVAQTPAGKQQSTKGKVEV